MTQVIQIFSGILLILYLGLMAGSAYGEQNSDELQVLIDVSGSMKQTDPHNARVEAMELLINLLPEDTKTGVWFFDENVRELIHTEAVNGDWKKQAAKAVAQIHSRGRFTDIEQAIAKVMAAGFKGSGQKHLILLTDGFVDISKDIMVSAESRERILSEWLPKLRQHNIRVLAISLSSQADAELMEAMAFTTGGWSLIAESADDLQRSFMKMMMKAAPKDHLPFVDNHFDVDQGVNEFAVLVFKKSDSLATALYTPAQKRIDKKNAAGNKVIWQETPAYVLITLQQPTPGQWRVDAEADPDDQVMIVSDLQIHLQELGSYFTEQEELPLVVSFTDKHKLITHNDFLKMLSFKLQLDQKDIGSLQALPGRPGFFGRTLSGLSLGKHTLELEADGEIFKRSIRQEFEIVPELIHTDVRRLEPKQAQISFTPDLKRLDEKSLEIAVNMLYPDKKTETKRVVKQHELWQLNLENVADDGDTELSFNVTANTVDGKAILVKLKPVILSGRDQTAVKAPPPESQKETAETPNPQPEPETAAEPAEPAEPEHQDETEAQPSELALADWLLISSVVLAINLVFFGCGYWIYNLIKSARLKKQQQILERLA